MFYLKNYKTELEIKETKNITLPTVVTGKRKNCFRDVDHMVTNGYEMSSSYVIMTCIRNIFSQNYSYGLDSNAFLYTITKVFECRLHFRCRNFYFSFVFIYQRFLNKFGDTWTETCSKNTFFCNPCTDILCTIAGKKS